MYRAYVNLIEDDPITDNVIEIEDEDFQSAIEASLETEYSRYVYIYIVL